MEDWKWKLFSFHHDEKDIWVYIFLFFFLFISWKRRFHSEMTNCLRGKKFIRKIFKSQIIRRKKYDEEEEEGKHLICENKNYLLINTKRSFFSSTAPSRGKFMMSSQRLNISKKLYLFRQHCDIVDHNKVKMLMKNYLMNKI